MLDVGGADILNWEIDKPLARNADRTMIPISFTKSAGPRYDILCATIGLNFALVKDE